jgi:cytochrome c-type biogenesis protein CcmH/NrfG
MSDGSEAAYFERVSPPPYWRNVAAKGDRSPGTYYNLARIYRKHGLLKDAAEATRYADKLAGKKP